MRNVLQRHVLSRNSFRIEDIPPEQIQFVVLCVISRGKVCHHLVDFLVLRHGILILQQVIPKISNGLFWLQNLLALFRRFQRICQSTFTIRIEETEPFLKHISKICIEISAHWLPSKVHGKVSQETHRTYHRFIQRLDSAPQTNKKSRSDAGYVYASESLKWNIFKGFEYASDVILVGLTLCGFCKRCNPCIQILGKITLHGAFEFHHVVGSRCRRSVRCVGTFCDNSLSGLTQHPLFYFIHSTCS